MHSKLQDIEKKCCHSHRHRFDLILSKDFFSLALKCLCFVFDSFHLLETIHVRLHDLSIWLHHFWDVGLFDDCWEFLVFRSHSYQTVVLGRFWMGWSAFSGFGFVDSIVWKFEDFLKLFRWILVRTLNEKCKSWIMDGRQVRIPDRFRIHRVTSIIKTHIVWKLS